MAKPEHGADPTKDWMNVCQSKDGAMKVCEPAAEPVKRVCVNCDASHKAMTNLQCRYGPPVVNPKDPSAWGVYPPVRVDGWCCKFKAKEPTRV